MDKASADPLMATMLAVVIMFGLFPPSHLLWVFARPIIQYMRARGRHPMPVHPSSSPNRLLCTIHTAAFWFPSGRFIMRAYYYYDYDHRRVRDVQTPKQSSCYEGL